MSLTGAGGAKSAILLILQKLDRGNSVLKLYEMDFADVINLYQKYKEKHGEDAYMHISALIDEAKAIHKREWLKNPTPQNDFEQSWKGVKGHILEKLIMHIIEDGVNAMGLKMVTDSKLSSEKLPQELKNIKRAVSVDYGKFGMQLPDADVVIYEPKNLKVIAILSSKNTLRERVAQTGYWKIKLSQDDVTKHIKVFFVTPDGDEIFSHKKYGNKGRVIVEVDTDGSYVMSDEEIKESDKVKRFDKFIGDLKKLIENND